MIDSFVEVCIAVAVFAPFVAALVMVIAPGRLAEPIGHVATLVTVAGVGLLLRGVLAGDDVAWPLFALLPGVEIAFRVDGLGMTFGLLASGLWVLVNVYNVGYIRADHLKHSRRYLACFAASIGSAIGVAFAGNLLTFLLFYEVLTLATYPLVVHKETPQAINAGRRYLLFALSGGLAVTAGSAWVWSLAGTLQFTPGGFMQGQAPPAILLTIFGLLLIGCAVKAAIMPLHSWLPAAMVAPSPVSALLHAVAVVKAGVFGCLRILGYVFGPESLDGTVGPAILLAFTATTIIAGSFIALRHDNLKRRLAYSTIVHLSFIVLGAALLSPMGTAGAVFHMVNHGLCKITLFLCAGAIYGTYHLENVSQLAGVGRRMPWTFGAFTVATLGLMGTPALCGFVSKQLLIRGAWQADQITYLLVMLVGSLFTAAYLLPVVRTAFFDEPAADLHPPEHGKDEARLDMLLPLLGTATLVAVFGLIPWAINGQYDLTLLIIRSIYGGPS